VRTAPFFPLMEIDSPQERPFPELPFSTKLCLGGRCRRTLAFRVVHSLRVGQFSSFRAPRLPPAFLAMVDLDPNSVRFPSQADRVELLSAGSYLCQAAPLIQFFSSRSDFFFNFFGTLIQTFGTAGYPKKGRRATDVFLVSGVWTLSQRARRKSSCDQTATANPPPVRSPLKTPGLTRCRFQGN